MDSCKGHRVTCQLYAAESSTLLAKSLLSAHTPGSSPCSLTFRGNCEPRCSRCLSERVSVPQLADSDWASACSKVLGEESSLGGGFPSGVRDSCTCWGSTRTVSVIMHKETAATEFTLSGSCQHRNLGGSQEQKCAVIENSTRWVWCSSTQEQAAPRSGLHLSRSQRGKHITSVKMSRSRGLDDCWERLIRDHGRLRTVVSASFLHRHTKPTVSL